MFLMISERVSSRADAIGNRQCVVCDEPRAFSQVLETNYFCLFGLRLLPIEQIANYKRCEHCQTVYRPDDLSQPAQMASIDAVLAYLLTGFGQTQRLDLAREISHKVSGWECQDNAIEQTLRRFARNDIEIHALLRDQAPSLNLTAKAQVVEAAFLLTHACCEIQHEDRVRVNLMANALGLSLELVEAVIQQVRKAGYLGVRRLVQAQSQPG